MTKRSVKRSHSMMPSSLFYRCTLALGITLCVGMLLLLLSTAIAYAQPDPATLAKPLSLVSLYTSVLLGGYIAAKGAERPYISGAICGIGMALCLMLISFIPWGRSDSMLSPLIIATMHAGVVAASVVGAWMTMRQPRKRTSHHKSRRRK